MSVQCHYLPSVSTELFAMDDTPLNEFHDHNASGQPQTLTSAGQSFSSDFGEKTHIEKDFLLEEDLISELGLLPQHCINIAEIDIECDMSSYLGLPQTQACELDRESSVCHHQSLQWREDCEALLASMTTTDGNETSSIKNLQHRDEVVKLPLFEQISEVPTDVQPFHNQNLSQSISTLSDAINFEKGFRINTEQQEMSNLQSCATTGGAQYPISLNSNSDLQDREELFENFDSGFEHDSSLVREFNEYRSSFPVCNVISYDEYYHPTHSEGTCPDSFENVGNEESSAGLCGSLFYGVLTNYDSYDTLISGKEILTHEENNTDIDNLVKASNDKSEHLVMVANDNNENLVNVCNDVSENYMVCNDKNEILVKVSHNNNVQSSEKSHFTPFEINFADTMTMTSLKHSVPAVANNTQVSAIQENDGVAVCIPVNKGETNISNNFMNREFEPSALHGTDKRLFPLCLERGVQGHVIPCVRFSDSLAGSDNRPFINDSSWQQDQSLLASGQQDKFGVNMGCETTPSCMVRCKSEVKADHNAISALMPKSVEAKNSLVKVREKTNIQEVNNEYNFHNSVALPSFAQIPQYQGIADNPVTDPVLQANNCARQICLLNSDETRLSLNKEPYLPNTLSDAHRSLIDNLQSGIDQKELRLPSTSPVSCSTVRFVRTQESLLKEGVKVSRGRKSVRVGKSGRFVSVPMDSVNRLMVRDLLSMSGNKPEKSIKEATQEYRRDRNRIIMQKQQRLKVQKLICHCPPGSSL